MIELLLLFLGFLGSAFTVYWPNRVAIFDAKRRNADDKILGDDRHDSIIPDPTEPLPDTIPVPVAHLPEEVPIDTVAAVPEIGLIEFILDAGHGPLTKGKRSPPLEDGKPMLEWEYNEAIIKGIVAQAPAEGLRVVEIIPDKTGIGNFLSGRSRLANAVVSKYPLLFISAHGNALDPAPGEVWQRKARGVECWHFHGSRLGFDLAAIFCEELCKETGMYNRGPKSKSTGQFHVLTATRMTSILGEVGFMNHPDDIKKMVDPAFRAKVIQGYLNFMHRVQRERVFG